MRFDKKTTAAWLDELRADIRPGDTIITVLRGVARSGMSRHIDVYRFYVEDGRVRRQWISRMVAAVCGFPYDEKQECLNVSGGMDMGWHVVYELSGRLFGDEKSLKQEWL
jgi:hypothetical protein